MSRLRLAGFSGALVLSALIGGTLISAALAAPAPTRAPQAPAPAPRSAAPTQACAAFRAAFAANLGKTEAQVTAAARAAILSTVDAAVADGTLTAEVAARIKTRISAAEADGCKLLSGWRAKAAGAAGVVKDGFAAAASALDLTPAELRSELRAGKTLKDVAAAKGVAYATVTAAVTASVDEDLDAAVAAGTLTQARADKIQERLAARLEAGWTRRGAPAAP
ncbi:MAG: hypothetical protein ACSLFN_02660 [Candidatus Limnocylindrales bacterium]